MSSSQPDSDREIRQLRMVGAVALTGMLIMIAVVIWRIDNCRLAGVLVGISLMSFIAALNFANSRTAELAARVRAIEERKDNAPERRPGEKAD